MLENTARRLFDISASGDIEFDDSIPTEKKGNFFKVPQIADLATPKRKLFNTYRDDITPDDSLNESSLSNGSSCDSPGFLERNLKLADVEKGLEVIGRGLAKDQSIGWREHWTFLNEFIDISSNEGLIKLEQYLQQRLKDKIKPSTNHNSNKFQEKLDLVLNQPSTPVSKICHNLNSLQFCREKTSGDKTSTPISPNPFHAYVCVEKSCQIYAKRLLPPITQQPNNISRINDALMMELNRLKSLVCSYKEDIRFFGIDFSAAHSRFAHIVVALLNNENGQQDGLNEIFRQCLTQILEAKIKVNMNKNVDDENTKNTSQLICLIKNLNRFLWLDDKATLIAPEILTTDRECEDVWKNEEKCDCEWLNNDQKVNRSIKRRNRISGGLNDFCSQLNGLSMNEKENGEDEENELFFVRILLFYNIKKKKNIEVFSRFRFSHLRILMMTTTIVMMNFTHHRNHQPTCHSMIVLRKSNMTTIYMGKINL